MTEIDLAKAVDYAVKLHESIFGCPPMAPWVLGMICYARPDIGAQGIEEVVRLIGKPNTSCNLSESVRKIL
jgi:hypothetical protein